MRGIIYVITNTVNGKQYVGQTTQLLSRRWWWHLRRTSDGACCALHYAIRKYCAEAFKIEQIDFAETIDELNEKEIYHIARLKTLTPNGYNMTIGGEGFPGVAITQKTRQKLSEASMGENNTQAKLSIKEAEIIRHSPLASACELAKKFNVSVSAVYRIRQGRSWRVA